MSDINVTVQDEIVNIDVIDTPVLVNVVNSPGQQGPAGPGVPVGGTAGQVLAKNSSTNYDTVWVNQSGGVPYSGATGNVNLGEYELKAGQVTLDTSPTGTAAVGTIRWNDTTGTSETTLKGGNVIIKNGVDLVARVVNKVTPNTTLTKAAYQAVKVSGAQGQRLAIELAQANNDAGSADTIGLVTETIAPNQEGFIMTVGQLEGINTTGSLQGETWTDGDVLYLSPTTAGAITNVKPTAVTGHIVVIGYVEYAHQNNGKIYVKVMNGWELDELHNVSIVTPTNNQGLFYNSSNSLWENKTISTALGYTPVPTTRNITINGVTYDLSADRTYTISTGISGSGTSGQVTYWTGASAVSGDNNLIWNSASIRLGIGRTPAARRLELQVANGSLASALGIYDGGGTLNTIFGIDTASTTDFQIASIQSIRFYAGSTLGNIVTNPTNERMRLYASTGNLAIGGTFASDFGTRLQVIGDTLLRGSGSTNATTALTVQNSDGTSLFRVQNGGQVFVDTGSFRANTIIGISGNVNIQGGTSGSYVRINAFANINSYLNVNIGTGAFTVTAGDIKSFVLDQGFAPTSGTATMSYTLINPTINQTGGANGITRGLYVNPTLTAAADFRAIETTAGNVLFGSNFFWDNTNGRLGIGTNAPLGTLNIRTTTTTSTAPPMYFSGTSNSTGLNLDYGVITLENRSTTAGTYSALLFTGGTNQYGFAGVFGVLGANTSALNWNGDLVFGTRNSNTFDQRLRLYSNGNLVLQNGGTFTDGGQRLQVVGDTLLRGSGATSATTALTVQNSSSTNLFTVRNDGNTNISNGLQVQGPLNGALSGAGFELEYNSGISYVTSYSRIAAAWLPMILRSSDLTITTGGTNRAQFFSSSGNLVLQNGGTFTDVASSRLTVNSTTQGFLPPRMTTTQKNAIATPAAGLVVYDTTLNKLCVYTTAWETITSV